MAFEEISKSIWALGHTRHLGTWGLLGTRDTLLNSLTVLNFLPRVPLHPTWPYVLTCLRAFFSYVPYLPPSFYVPYVSSFFTYMTCLYFFTCFQFLVCLMYLHFFIKFGITQLQLNRNNQLQQVRISKNEVEQVKNNLNKTK